MEPSMTRKKPVKKRPLKKASKPAVEKQPKPNVNEAPAQIVGYLVPANIFNSVLEYIGRGPHNEVHHIMMGLSTARPVGGRTEENQ